MFMVGSCIRFLDGQPDKDNFRKFKIKTVKTQDDYACLQEIVKRRYKDKKELPDLILIDGGKGQLSAITTIMPEAEVASLAKKEETVFSKRIPQGRILNLQNYGSQILIALRDYAHHFAISYHRKISKI
jgi:excinuclease ABC subunit C